MTPPTRNHFRALIANPAAWVLLLALGIRIYAALATHIINPDGIIYIHQARAIFYHQWNAITACGMKYISILPPMISAAFWLCRDWESAGRLISVLFGFGALVPLYFLIRRFFDKHVAVLVLLIYAFIPALVGRSADIIRDPVYWFFLTSGLLMVVRHLDHAAPVRLNLPASAILLALAGWARIEAILFILITAGYLLVFGGKRRFKHTLWFLAPLMILAACGVIALLMRDASVAKFLRIDKISAFVGLQTNYQQVRAGVQALAQDQSGVLYLFLKQAGDFVWVLPLGPLLDCLFEKFFYPYVLIFFAGFVGLRKRLKEDPRVLYFLLLCAGAVLMLYLHLLNTWLIYDRFLANLIFPAVVLVGYGCENLLRLGSRRFRRPATACIVLASVILLFGAGKNLRPRYEEKIMFRQMARQVLQTQGGAEVIRIAALESNAYEWVFFYANQQVAAAPCPKGQRGEILPDYGQFVEYLKSEGIRHVLWSPKVLGQVSFNLLQTPYANDFDVIASWRQSAAETYTLLALKRP